MMIPHRGGLPHSDTQGSTPARGFPWIFAACHVLHRLLAPRHPPDALLLLTPARANARASSKPRHAQEPSTAQNPGQQTTPVPWQGPHSAHIQNALNAMASQHARPKPPIRQPRHSGQTTHANPPRTPPAAPPKRSRAQAKPAEPSRASKTHQNLIHNP